MAEIMESDEKSRVIYGPTILLSNGQYFDFLKPEASIWHVDELATALGKVCRFAGHCNGFYSVAEHSLLVAELVPPAYRLAALLHDAHEAFTGDITYPLKRLLGEIVKPIEARIDQVIAERFGLNSGDTSDPIIKKADRWMLWIEQRQLMSNSHDWEATLQPPAWAIERAGKIEGVDWQHAAAIWAAAVHFELRKACTARPISPEQVPY